MNVYGIDIPDKPLTNFELLDYAKKLHIPHFRGVFMKNDLPKLVFPAMALASEASQKNRPCSVGHKNCEFAPFVFISRLFLDLYAW